MKQFKKVKLAALVGFAMTGLYGCGGGGASTVEPTNVPVVLEATSADISGSAIKGTLVNALVSVSQANGSAITLSGGDRTGDDGQISFKVESQKGFGIGSMFKIDVTADAQTSMVCDAIACGDAALGESLSGDLLNGTVFKSLVWVDVPFKSQSDGQTDASFQANALTTIAALLTEQQVAAGRNVGVRELYELALAENSKTALKALGSKSKANLFTLPLVSAESYDNFVDGETCVDNDGTQVCSDNLQSGDVIHASLLNAAFAHMGAEGNLNQSMADVIAAINMAYEGDSTALKTLREKLVASIAALPHLSELGVSAEDVVDVNLAFLDASSSTGPVRQVTTADVISSATLTARYSISDGENQDKAFDGNSDTKWLDHNDWKGAPTAEDPAWIQVQFAQPQAVNSVFITSANDAPERDPENFNLAASHDGENWVTLASFIGESFDERFERKEFRFSNGLSYPYYRLNITKNKGDSTLMQLADIDFVGPIYTSSIHSENTQNITVRDQISDGEAGPMAFDGSSATKWLDNQSVPSVDDPSWAQVDFAEAVTVDTLAMTSANDAPERDPENFNLLGSNDGGSTWVKLASFIGESFDQRFERKLFQVDNGLAFSSYRLEITKNKGDSNLMQVAEIELIGADLPALQHSHMSGVTYEGRNRISDGEAEPKAFDGDSQTKWLDHNDWKGAPTAEDPSWVVVTLPEAKVVNTLALTSANDAPERDPENFNLQGSMDGETWVDLASWIGESFDERFERKQWTFSNSLPFSSYRFNITKNKGDSTLMQIAEIELIGPQYAAVNHGMAAGATYSARFSISDGENQTKVFDGDTQTKWLDHNDWKGAPTEEDPAWVQVDLAEGEIVSTLAITSANDAPSRDPENFNLVGSNDGGQTWTVIGSWIGESFDNRFERKVFDIGNGFSFTSYRLNVTKNKGDDGLMQIAEVELIGPPSAEPEVN